MRHLLATSTVVALLASAGAVTAQEASLDPGASPTLEQLAAAEERLATATCLGKPATMVAIEGFETVGTPGADVIVGTTGDDVIRGAGGNDRICAGDGADLVEGGDGKDRIEGGAGDDQLDGGAGNDTVNGGKGADMVTGAAGNDRLIGAAGDDTLDGGKGNDVCVGGKGHDWLPGCNDKRRTTGRLVIGKNTTLKGPHKSSIVIAADKVTLDCGGHTVTGPGAGFGITLEGRTGVTVKDCDVSNFAEGFHLINADRNTLSRNRAHDNSQHGISLWMSNKNRLTSNIADDNGIGRDHTDGFVLGRSHDNVLKRNSASGNGNSNFALRHGASRNTLSHNTSVGSRFGFEVSGNHHTLNGNSATRARLQGFGSDANNSVFTDNTVTGTIAEAAFRLGGTRNTFTGNVAHDNGHLGFEDVSVPGANSYEGNTCIGNRGGGSSPEGLCDDTIRVEPESSPEPGDSPEPDGAPEVEA